MRTKLKILTIVLVVVCVSVIIGLMVSKTTTAKPKSTTNKNDTNITDSNLVAVLKNKLESKYSFISSTTLDSTNTIGYPAAHDNFDIILPTSASNSISFKDKNAVGENTAYSTLMSVSEFMDNFFKANNYALVGNSQDSSFLSDAIYYQDSQQVCQVTIYSLLDITCYSKSQFNTIATVANPLVQAYVGQSNTDEGLITVSPPTVNNSKTAGYKLAIMNISNNSGQTKVYYYSDNNGGWQEVNLNWYNDPHEDGDIMPNCEDFESNPSVARAFAGFNCYDSAKREISVIKS